MTKFKPHDYVLAVGLFLFILAGLFPPWLYRPESGTSTQGFHWLFAPPNDGVNMHVDAPKLFIEWILIAVVTAVVYFFIRRNRMQPPKPPPLPTDTE